MSLDAATVRRIAALARIRLDDTEVDRMRAELGGILGWIEQLNEVDVSAVEPLAGGMTGALPMRDDVVTDGGIAERILANSPDRSKNWFAVPKVVE